MSMLRLLLTSATVTSCIIVILRLITSAYLRTHSDEFSPFLFALEDDPRFAADGGITMKEFCEREVEVSRRSIPL